jgi:hypothetical protein
MAEQYITQKHSDHLEYDHLWDKIRDVIEGEERIKERGTEYLPKLGGQTDPQYQAYKDRALFFNATGRTREALVGMAFRKNPTMEIPDNIEDIKDNLSLKDESAKGFAKRLVREDITTGRAGILVDHPRVDDSRTRTRAEAQKNGQFPYLTMYKAEEIRNWHVQREQGQTELKAVILHEEFENQDGYFGANTEDQWRLLELTDEVDGFGGEEVYRQRVWRRSADDDFQGRTLIEDVVPLVGGEPMNEIPFFFNGVTDTTSQVQTPPLLDLVNVNLSHYRSQADLEHGAHFTALPTPYVVGGDAEEMSLAIGPSEWNIAENENAEFGLLEYDGKGLDQLRQVIKDKEDMMADLGARLVMDVESATDATETVQLKQMGQNSILANIVDTSSMALQKAITFMSKWQSGNVGADVEARVKINKDFFPQPISPDMIKQLLAARQQGRITDKTFFRNLKQGEVIDEETTFDNYQDKLTVQSEQNLSEL